MSEKEIYTRFVAWLDKGWWRLPPSEHLLPSIDAFFTTDEAALLTGLPFVPTALKELADLKGMKCGDLAAKLDTIARKGAVWKIKRGGSILYSLNDAFFIFFRGPFYATHPDQAARAMAPSLNRYIRDGLMDQLAPSHTKGLRTIPINRTVDDPRRIAPYEDVLAIVESQDFIVVTPCACRQRKHMDPEFTECNHPKEVCLHFKNLARYLVEIGMGRRITREEAKEILNVAADEGLVHAVSNWQKDPDTICNCCSCSCIFFESYHALKHKKSHDFSNYRLKANPQTCKACGSCVKRCPVRALRLKESPLAENELGKAATLDSDACLGCGVCAHKCPTRSLSLELRAELQPPPQDMREWAKRWMTDQKQAREAGRESKKGA
jgi:Na+-translocating ferredoxin:NAD+ oxidoreductase subunit B